MSGPSRIYERERRRLAFAKYLKHTNLLHVERLESRAHPSSSILGLAVGSLFTDDNQFDLQSRSEEAITEEPTAQPAHHVAASPRDAVHANSAPRVTRSAAALGGGLHFGEMRLREPPHAAVEQIAAQNSSGVPKWYEALALSLLTANNPSTDTASSEPTDLPQLTASGVSAPTAASTATPSLQPSISTNATVSSESAQPANPPITLASMSSGGGGGGPTVTYSDAVPTTEGDAISLADLAALSSSYSAEGEGCGCGCNGGGSGGSGCGSNTGPCVTRYNYCGADPNENLASEVFLDYYGQDIYDLSKTEFLGDYFEDAEDGDDLDYTIVVPPPSPITADIIADAEGNALLKLTASAPGAVFGTMKVRGTDSDGASADWCIHVYSVEVTGFEVQERAWSEASWDAPEDSGADWDVLWKHDNHRWRPMIAPPEAIPKMVTHWWKDGTEGTFANADWCLAPEGMLYSQWDKWAYGTPIDGGETQINPTVKFSSPDLWGQPLLSAPAFVHLKPPIIGTPAAPRIGVHQVASVEWEQVPYAQTKLADGLGDQNFAALTAPTSLRPYWAVFPETDGTITYDAVEVKVNITPSIPAGMAGDVHAAWYDPINTVANVSSTPPTANAANAVRDNEASLSLLGSKTLEFTAGTQSKSSFYELETASEDFRVGDNFIVAVHPHDGFETEYFFDSNEQLNYDGDFPDAYNCQMNPGQPDFNGSPVPNLLPATLQSPILVIAPPEISIDIDTDSDNNTVLDRSAFEDSIEVESPGKLVRLNNDDDNVDGIADHLETTSWGTLIDDDLIEVALGFPVLPFPLDGFTFEILGGISTTISVWASRSRDPISNVFTVGVDTIPTTLFVEGRAIGTANLSWTLKTPQGHTILSDTVLFTVVSGDLRAHRQRTPVFQDYVIPPELEDSIGIRRNGDDDNGDLFPDGFVSPIPGEDDTMELETVTLAGGPGVEWVITRSNEYVSIWSDANKSSAVLGTAGLASTPAGTNVSNAAVIPGGTTLWIEWPFNTSAQTTVSLYVRAANTQNGHVVVDTVTYEPFDNISVVIMGEFMVPADPAQNVPGDPGATNGLMQWAIDQYRFGYDVYVFDEPDYFQHETQPMFSEIRKAVNTRGISSVAAIGYSHGGGTVWQLADRLSTATDITNPFELTFTGYIDAISQSGVFGNYNWASVNWRPTNSVYHVSQFQKNNILLRGDFSDADDDLDRSYLGVSHVSIDDNSAILDFLESRFRSRISK